MAGPVRKQTEKELRAFQLILEESNGIFMKMEGFSDFKPGFCTSYAIEILRMIFLTSDLFIAKTFENLFGRIKTDRIDLQNNSKVSLISTVASILRSESRLLRDVPFYLVQEIVDSGLIDKKELKSMSIEKLLNRAFIRISPAGDAMDFYNICIEWNREMHRDIDKLLGPDSELKFDH
jgi:hypothetical protein